MKTGTQVSGAPIRPDASATGHLAAPKRAGGMNTLLAGVRNDQPFNSAGGCRRLPGAVANRQSRPGANTGETQVSGRSAKVAIHVAQ